MLKKCISLGINKWYLSTPIIVGITSLGLASLAVETAKKDPAMAVPLLLISLASLTRACLQLRQIVSQTQRFPQKIDAVLFRITWIGTLWFCLAGVATPRNSQTPSPKTIFDTLVAMGLCKLLSKNLGALKREMDFIATF